MKRSSRDLKARTKSGTPGDFVDWNGQPHEVIGNSKQGPRGRFLILLPPGVEYKANAIIPPVRIHCIRTESFEGRQWTVYTEDEMATKAMTTELREVLETAYAAFQANPADGWYTPTRVNGHNPAELGYAVSKGLLEADGDRVQITLKGSSALGKPYARVVAEDGPAPAALVKQAQQIMSEPPAEELDAALQNAALKIIADAAIPVAAQTAAPPPDDTKADGAFQVGDDLALQSAYTDYRASAWLNNLSAKSYLLFLEEKVNSLQDTLNAVYAERDNARDDAAGLREQLATVTAEREKAASPEFETLFFRMEMPSIPTKASLMAERELDHLQNKERWSIAYEQFLPGDTYRARLTRPVQQPVAPQPGVSAQAEPASTVLPSPMDPLSSEVEALTGFPPVGRPLFTTV